MARPIEATPVLKREDADAVLRELRRDEPVSDDRMRWLDELAEASRSADNRNR